MKIRLSVILRWVRWQKYKISINNTGMFEKRL
jgi:hypothetical protein